MNDEILSTRREHRLDEARSIFNKMQRLLTRVMESDEIQLHMGAELAEEINTVLDRAALAAF
jgi:hypothetical protein